ncbi:MAG: hypothetical protein MHM6MM_004287 [Cercozoa sp. M6MM]
MRAVLKNVCAYMTLGIDMSSLFSSMIMAAHTRDIVQKKMVYLYLCEYANKKPDLTLLAVNTLQKDCEDEDSTIAGLALRALCSLKVPKLLEYALQMLRRGLRHRAAYVRKTAALGVAKLHLSASEQVQMHTDLVESLRGLLNDGEPTVVFNALCALNEMSASRGGLQVDRVLTLKLLNQIGKFSHWQQCQVLHMIARYQPDEQQECFQIMSLLDARLRHQSPSIVLATVKVFLEYTKHTPEVRTQVYERVKSPLLSLLGGAQREMSHAALAHVALLVEQAPHVFSDSASVSSLLLCPLRDSIGSKLLKLHILQQIVNAENWQVILSDIAQYAFWQQQQVSSAAIQALANIAIMRPETVRESCCQLLELLALEDTAAKALAALTLVLRAFPHVLLPEHDTIALRARLDAFVRTRALDWVPTQENRSSGKACGKSALFWFLGEFATELEAAPYILEKFIDAFEFEIDTDVKLAMLTATAKVFFKRPPEAHEMFLRLLRSAIQVDAKIFELNASESVENTEKRADSAVRDRALQLLKLLKHDVHEAARVVNCAVDVVERFVDAEQSRLQTALLAHFDSVAVVLRRTPADFLKGGLVPDWTEEQDDEDDEDEEEEDTVDTPTTVDNAYGGAGTTEDFLGDVYGSPAANNAAQPDGAADVEPVVDEAPPAIVLEANVAMSPALFQQKWREIGSVVQRRFQISADTISTTTQLLKSSNIHTMASGKAGERLKYFFYAKLQDTLVLMQTLVHQATGQVDVVAKGARNDAIEQVLDIMQGALVSQASGSPAAGQTDLLNV